MHYAKAFMRSKLWQPDSWPDRSTFPTLGQILTDQMSLDQSADSMDSWLDDAYAKCVISKFGSVECLIEKVITDCVAEGKREEAEALKPQPEPVDASKIALEVTEAVKP